MCSYRPLKFGAARGESERSIARRLDREPSTIMREIDKNGPFQGTQVPVSQMSTTPREPQ